MYYTRMFAEDMRRDPTNVELFDIAQSNSEHRHARLCWWRLLQCSCVQLQLWLGAGCLQAHGYWHCFTMQRGATNWADMHFL